MTQETALKLALKAFEQIFESTPPYRDDGTCVINDKSVELSNKAIAAIKEALAQTQEPVADDFFRMIADKNPKPFQMDKDEQITRMAQPSKEFSGFQEARRTWVGLFDEEIEVLFQTAAGADEEVHIRFARAIESKIKELNT